MLFHLSEASAQWGPERAHSGKRRGEIYESQWRRMQETTVLCVAKKLLKNLNFHIVLVTIGLIAEL